MSLGQSWSLFFKVYSRNFFEFPQMRWLWFLVWYNWNINKLYYK
ncbi:hypothetical protein SAMN05216475_4717 [Pseudomonas synxantha]|uniref:Uncharacterized protein n=1 Tax=Pseudomonas synxantha TaxID=47883 RepID=A0AAX3IDA6_9PSED|nr:hypothetical protein SAMN05216475_4717 [Pseudomonas synxantha]VTR04706.1 Uncharacterised protein [Pseudomonas synxantha]